MDRLKNLLLPTGVGLGWARGQGGWVREPTLHVAAPCGGGARRMLGQKGKTPQKCHKGLCSPLLLRVSIHPQHVAC